MSGRCLCRTCGERFNSCYAFDKHRIGAYDLTAPNYGRRCLTVAEMRAAGMATNAGGWWVTSFLSPAHARWRRDHRPAVGAGRLSRIAPGSANSGHPREVAPGVLP